jgi:hypothetical protein
LAIGAFAVLAVAGAVTAGTELPSVTALWADSYGRTLSVKLALVAAIASISYVHAVKLRPRLLASSAARSATERRHWRLLSTEPLLAAGVIVAAAWLAASGPPPSALASDPAARPGATDSLSVAGQAGPYIINAVVTRRPRDVDVELRTLDALERPIAIAARVAGTIRQRRCGVGCTRLTLWRPPTAVTVEVTDRGYAYRTSIPSRFVPGSTQLAQRLVSDVASSSRDLRSVAIAETLGDGRGGSEVTQYRVRSPNRFAYRLLRDGHTIAETIIVGGRQWTQKGGRGTWKVSPYGASGLQFSSRAYLNWWTQYATEPRLLGIVDARRQADVAAMTAVAGLGTVWLRLRIDLAHKRLLRVQMITVAHFMTQTWAEFNAPTPIHPPWHCSSLRG